MTDEKLLSLLGQLSLQEKIGQLVQVPGGYYEDSAVFTGADTRDDAQARYLTLAGSTLSIVGAEKLRTLQKTYMENHPHHIPMLFMMDVIHGLNTVFPIPLAQGGSFDEESVEQWAAAAAREASLSGLHVTFTPMCDLVRDSRWGRVMESPGEDPWLNGKMAAAIVRGFQGRDFAQKDTMAACIKHFAAYGAATAGLDYQNVELSRQTLRQFYLPAYQQGIAAGAELVMTSFNLLEGVPASASRYLMLEILRQELGFEGILISDWNAIGELVNHGYCSDLKQAAYEAMTCQVDIDMCSGAYAGYLEELIEEGKISMEQLDRSVLRVLRLKNKLGLFENPYRFADTAREEQELLCAETRLLARDAVRKTAVLLKNESFLPLDRQEKVAFIGPFAADASLHGGWAFLGRDQDTVMLRQAAEAVFPKAVFARGSTLLDNGTIYNCGKYYDEHHDQVNRQLLQEAVELARSADKVVLCLGEHRMQTGEAASRCDIRLPKCQRKLLERVAEVNPNVAMVGFAGRPLVLTEEEPLLKAILWAWMPGTEGGSGVTDLLCGDYAPQAKVPMSFPWTVGQLPMSYNYMISGRKAMAREQPYCTRYLDAPMTPLYPFGHGLTYTEFAISPVELDSRELVPGDTLTAWVEVENVGPRQGTQILQLYIRDLVSSRVRPVKELAGIRPVTLAPGEKERVSFSITEEMLRFPLAQGGAVSEPGDFHLWIGFSSETENRAQFHLV